MYMTEYTSQSLIKLHAYTCILPKKVTAAFRFNFFPLECYIKTNKNLYLV